MCTARRTLAKVLFVTRALFERQPGFVHGLENFRGALKEEIAEFGSALVGEKSSLSSLDSLVNGGVVLVNHVKLRRKAEKAFGMTDEQISLGIQAAVELFDKAFLLGLVEINHHVAAENRRRCAAAGIRFSDCENRIGPNS